MTETPPEPIRLHLGCGQNYKDGWVNCDHGSHLRTDRCFDMDAEGQPWPIADNSVGELLSHHNLEHCRNFLWVMSEIYRICIPDALLRINVPYISSSLYNAVNPYHHTHFNEFKFEFFNPDSHLYESANERPEVRLLTESVQFHYFPDWVDKSDAEKNYGRRHYWNVVMAVDFVLRVLKDPPEKG